MFNLLTKNKLNESFIHRTTFLFFSSNSIPPPLSILQQQLPGEIGKLKYLCVFYYFPPRFGNFFDWANQKKLTTICIPTDGNFPIFENSTLSGRRKSDLIFSLHFQSYSLYSNFLLNLASCHLFSLTRRITVLLVNFSCFQADKSPASLIRKFPSLCFQYECFSFSPVLSGPLVWQSSALRST